MQKSWVPWINHGKKTNGNGEMARRLGVGGKRNFGPHKSDGETEGSVGLSGYYTNCQTREALVMEKRGGKSDAGQKHKGRLQNLSTWTRREPVVLQERRFSLRPTRAAGVSRYKLWGGVKGMAETYLFMVTLSHTAINLDRRRGGT